MENANKLLVASLLTKIKDKSYEGEYNHELVIPLHKLKTLLCDEFGVNPSDIKIPTKADKDFYSWLHKD